MERRRFLKSILASAAVSSGAAAFAQKETTSLKAQHMDADVVIVGAGFAGLSAAVAAARAGARTIVLEKRAYVGGDGILSAGIIASAASIVHAEQGLSEAADLEKYWAALERGAFDEPLSKVRDNMPNSPAYSGIVKHDPRVLRRCAEMSSTVIAFLRSFGIQFQPINPLQPFLTPSKPSSMPQFAQALVDELKRLQVRLLTDAEVVRIVTEKDTSAHAPQTALRAAGIEARHEGKSFVISAPSIVLATGGFIDNKHLLNRYKRIWANIPKGFVAVGQGVPGGHNGDGITMGRLVGAAIEDMESMPKLFAAPKAGQKSPSWILFDTDTAYLVDKQGQRFCDEHKSRYAGCALECFRQKIDGAFVVFDEKTFSGPNKNRWRYEELLSQKGLFKANTIEEAAAAAGISPDGLRKTLETISTDAVNGQGDTAFGRRDALFRALKPPYYVSTPSYPVCFKTEGGLEVNPNFQALRAADDAPIPGLYAAGATCGSISTRLCDVIASGLIVGSTSATASRRK